MRLPCKRRQRRSPTLWLLRLLCLALLLASTAAHAAPDLKTAAARARDVAQRLQAALDPDQKGWVTMAAAILEDGTLIIATSEKGRYLRSPVDDIRRAERADVADGPPGCAERKIINYIRTDLFRRNKKILVVAAGRPICEPCEQAILADGAKPAGRCKSGRSYL